MSDLLAGSLRLWDRNTEGPHFGGGGVLNKVHFTKNNYYVIIRFLK